MRKILSMIFILSSLALLSGENYRIVSTKTGKTVSVKAMVKELSKSDVIFFGEKHDDPVIHSLQQMVLPVLYKQRKNLIVSFEMFERDVQPVVDAYLKGEITQEEFLAQSRPWGNYATDYAPLLEFAKSNGLKVLAANVPREYAGKVNRNGTDFLANLSESEKAMIAVKITTMPGSYKDHFLQTMSLMTDHGMPGDVNFMDRLFFAQCMKDDTMAESIVRALEASPKSRIIHFNGDFHSQYYLGTVERVKSRAPHLRLAVISYLFTENPGVYRLSSDDQTKGDFIIILSGSED